ncbi:hypothetical protein M569_02051, partial [Genlisea aurea]
MDGRSWLWRRRSFSGKIPSGETESSTGSLSSLSERFSDDQNVSNTHNQSPELTSKSPGSDEKGGRVEALSEKLSEALVNIKAKEDLIKQHAKVAEEAVSGWERAENEASALKKLNDALTQKNLVLDQRVSQLDGALKECLKQLRQAKEEQERKVHETVAEKSSELESKKSQLEAAEKENSTLQSQLLSKDQELVLSTRAAENASKLHLESIKKVAKLEAECRRLKKAVAHGSTSSFSDSQPENEDPSSAVINMKDERTLGKSTIFPSLGTGLMDDFLEMERLAATAPSAETCQDADKVLEHELGPAIKRATDLEEILKISDNQLERMRENLVDLEMQLAVAKEEKIRLHKELDDSNSMLEKLSDLLDKAERKIVSFQDQLKQANAAKNILQIQLEDANRKSTEAESQKRISEMDTELQALYSNVFNLEKQIEKEKQVSREALTKCSDLEAEITTMQQESESKKSVVVAELQLNQEKELEVAASKFAECQKTISSLGLQLEFLAAFDDFLKESSE